MPLRMSQGQMFSCGPEALGYPRTIKTFAESAAKICGARGAGVIRIKRESQSNGESAPEQRPFGSSCRCFSGNCHRLQDGAPG